MAGNTFAEFEAKMNRAGVHDAAIRAFRHNYEMLKSGETGMIPEESIEQVRDLPRLDQLPGAQGSPGELLSQCLVIKLNGGLGTSMGLERAKSLLEIKDGLNFLDFIARQILQLRKTHQVPLRFMLMNSFSTSEDSLAFLKRYPDLGQPGEMELMQSQAPKVDAETLRPVVWPENPQLEWCPPGHGDIYPSLAGSGWLRRLRNSGVKYAFVSNSDNLGASLDLSLLKYFADSGKSFIMEVAERTTSDRKGGHLALRDGRFLLRESAQCPEADMESFQDINRHRFFNTNNLWLRLDHLEALLQEQGGFVALPMIKNTKTVDPRNKHSKPVIQVESAMGAAIQCFENTGAVVVPRARFAPVKTTSDLLALRSDAYTLTEDWRLVLAPGRVDEPPSIDLDPTHYKLVDQLDEKLRGGVPSLKRCVELRIRGAVSLSDRCAFAGKVSIVASSTTSVDLPAGEYCDQTVSL